MKEFNQIIDIAFNLTGASPIAAKFLLSLKSGKYEVDLNILTNKLSSKNIEQCFKIIKNMKLGIDTYFWVEDAIKQNEKQLKEISKMNGL